MLIGNLYTSLMNRKQNNCAKNIWKISLLENENKGNIFISGPKERNFIYYTTKLISLDTRVSNSSKQHTHMQPEHSKPFQKIQITTLTINLI